jgi:hypothetical protein
MEHKKKQTWDHSRKAKSFNEPVKSGIAAPMKTQTLLITNNFKI